MTASRLPLLASAGALLCFGLVALFNSGLTRNLEGRDDYALRAAVLWCLAHVVGAVTSFRASPRSGWLALLAIVHAGLALFAGGIAAFMLLLSGTRFH